VNASPARPTLDERRQYVARSRQESFIVPLLNSAISAALSTHAARRASALDVGCGGQPFRDALESLGCAYTSIDTQAQPGIPTDFLCAIDQPLPAELLASAPFDFILCTEVLEHVADWPTAFANFHRLLATGGVLLITCPHVYPLHEEPYDFWRPTPHALRAFADRFSFDVLELRQLGSAWHVLGTILASAAPAPATRGPLSAVAAALARPARSLAIKLIQLGIPQRLIRPKGNLYLSNLAVLQRRAAIAPEPAR
jgi:SAM-dependent methyltransferase